MTDDLNRTIPENDDIGGAEAVDAQPTPPPIPNDEPIAPLPHDDGGTPPNASANGNATPADDAASDADFGARLERLGGEPAPAITPEEFARLQKAGQVHIDARGRVRSARRSDAEAGVSLTKRRAWYSI